MAMQGTATAVGQECLQEATNVKTEFVGVKDEPFDEESGIVMKTEVIIKEERDEDYTERVCEKDEEGTLDVDMAPRLLHSQAAVQLQSTRSSLKHHHALDAEYQEQHDAPLFDESLDKPTQDKDNNGMLPSMLEKIASVSDDLSAKKKETKRQKREKQQVSLHAKLLESQLEMVKLMNKNAELELNIKNAILEEKLKQEKLSKILGLRLK